MTETPEFDDFQRELQKLRRHPLLRARIKGDELRWKGITVEEVARLLGHRAAYSLLLAAAKLTRTTLKKATLDPEVAITTAKLRPARAVVQRLPVRTSFNELVARAEAVRSQDLQRKARGTIEEHFKQRLVAEKIPILMAKRVAGLLVSQRKPDGVWPDPADDEPPQVWLEIKNVRRVSDDIQKRLYEIAEVSLEMKLLYGRLELTGLGVSRPSEVLAAPAGMRAMVRAQIVGVQPVVVALLLCPRPEAERYRAGAEAFIDHVFFQDEIEACLDVLRAATRSGK